MVLGNEEREITEIYLTKSEKMTPLRFPDRIYDDSSQL